MARTRRTKKEIEEARARGESFRDQTGGNRSRKVEGKTRSERGVDLRTVQGSVFRSRDLDPEREAERSRKFSVRIAERNRKEALKIETDRINQEEKDKRDKQNRIDELNQIQAEQDELDQKTRAKEQQGFSRQEAIQQVERDDFRTKIGQGDQGARNLAIEDFAEDFENEDSAQAREVDAQIDFIYKGVGIAPPSRTSFLKSSGRFDVDTDGNVFITPIERGTTGFEEAQVRAGNPKSLTDFDNDPTTFAKDGFFGMVNTKTRFVVGEKGKREFVNVMPKNNMFEFARGTPRPKTKNKAKNNMFDMSFNNSNDNIFNPLGSKKSKGKKRKKGKNGKKANNNFDFLSGF